ncbi:MAG: polysaccharide biosynthesis/export family protein [Roseiarcus sp.]
MLNRRDFVRLAVLAIAFPTMAGCSMIPDSGPSRRDVESQATAALPAWGDGSILDYALVDLNRYVLPLLEDPGPGSLFGTFGAGHGPLPEIKVGVGDTVQVTLFEAQAGGLFIPIDAGSRPGNFVTLPNQTVDAKGFITVPYAGEVRALNRGTPAIQKEIIDKLKNRAIDPQAVVAIVSQTSTEVTVVGDVSSPGKIPINPAGDRVLDAISRAGGIRNPGYEEFVTLQRRGLKGTVYFVNLVKDPRENVFVAPGDILYVYQYQRQFMAFGATGATGQFKFLQENVTLDDAVAKAGGLLDDRAEPGQVFVYRMELRSTLEKMGVDASKFPPEREEIPTIFRVNFRDPSSFFAARRFPMQDNDIIYVDNADQVEITKFLLMIATVTGATSAVANDAANTKGSVLYLQNRCRVTSGVWNCP